MVLGLARTTHWEIKVFEVKDGVLWEQSAAANWGLVWNIMTDHCNDFKCTIGKCVASYVTICTKKYVN